MSRRSKFLPSVAVAATSASKDKVTAAEAAAKKKRQREQRRQRPPPPPDHLRDIATFCARNGISESYYFALKRADRGPKEIRLGKRVLISPEAEADWRRDREAETQTMQAAEATAESSTATAS